ncbi:SWIM zinc finger family protein [Nonomuraea ferruginea]
MLSIDLSPGLVSAAVQGSRRTPYEVTIAIEAYGEDRWETLESAIAEQAVYRAKLLAGEMPEEIEELFASVGVDLFPRDLGMDCSCPDWGFPCKHVSAVLYLLAESFGEDPFLVLAWRGRGARGAAGLARRPARRGRPGGGGRAVRGAAGGLLHAGRQRAPAGAPPGGLGPAPPALPAARGPGRPARRRLPPAG